MKSHYVAIAASTWLALFCSGAHAANANAAVVTSSSSSRIESDPSFVADLIGAERALEGDEDSPSSVDSKPWGSTIAATLIVNAVTLSGVVTLLPIANYLSSSNSKVVAASPDNVMQSFPVSLDISLSAFSAGAILSAATMLLFPESLYKIHAGYLANPPDNDPHAGHNHRSLVEDEEEHLEEIPVDVVWKWGTFLLAGYLLSYLLDLFFSPCTSSSGDDLNEAENSTTAIAEVLDGDKSASSSSSSTDITIRPSAKAQNRLIRGILIGDFFHNFVDGVFIASAFSLCNDELGWTIVLSTIFHELPQEIADFYLLTGYCGLSVKKAIVLNFISGMSVLIGGIFILTVDTSDTVLGAILGIGGGVYLHIGASEAMPHASNSCRTFKHQLMLILSFMAGAALVGLVLLDHEHCEAGGDDSHAGHNHL